MLLNAPAAAVTVKVLPSSLRVAKDVSPTVTLPVPETLVTVKTPFLRVPSASTTVSLSTALLNLICNCAALIAFTIYHN